MTTLKPQQRFELTTFAEKLGTRRRLRPNGMSLNSGLLANMAGQRTKPAKRQILKGSPLHAICWNLGSSFDFSFGGLRDGTAWPRCRSGAIQARGSQAPPPRPRPQKPR